MRLKIKQANLAGLLDHIYRIVERKNTIPILGNVRLDADKGQLSGRGTNLDIQVITHAAAIVERAGAATVNVHVFNDIVRKHKPDTTFTLDDNGRTMSVKAGRSSFELPTLLADHFPAHWLMDGASHSFTLPAPVLRGMIEPIEPAIANETTRLYLTGIYIHMLGDKILRAVATDGYRLGLTQIEAPEGCVDLMPGVIVPKKTIAELSRLLADSDATVTVHLSAEKIQFTVEDVILTSKLLAGTYPDYGRTIPQNTLKLTVNKQELADAVDRVSTVGLERRGMKFALREGCVELSVQGLEKGMAREEVSVDYQGEPLEIGFNSKYLLDAIGQLGDSIEIELTDMKTPTLVRTAGTEDPFYVLMPMRV